MSYFDEEKKSYDIDKNSHYFALMNPICDFGFFADASICDWVECEIVEDRYKVDEGYKVTLKPLDSNYASRHFYQCDFISLMEKGYIIEKTDDSFHIEHEEIYIPLTDTVYLVYNGNYIADCCTG
ncbi:MAG: hypothetical protein LIR46_05640 [Bacteroidota bacterium]|nr:hypothetical protein [Bacteroidota bacterium]